MLINHRRVSGAGALLLAGALAVGISVPASADDSADSVQDFPALHLMMDVSGRSTTSQFTVAKGEYTTAAGQRISLAASSVYTCTGKTDNPHWSSGSASVIAKTRVTCTGAAGNIPIIVESLLGRTTHNSISSLQIVAESNYTQNVLVNGAATTWYVPALGSATRIARGAYFRGSHSAEAAPPLIPFNIGAAASAFVYVG